MSSTTATSSKSAFISFYHLMTKLRLRTRPRMTWRGVEISANSLKAFKNKLDFKRKKTNFIVEI